LIHYSTIIAGTTHWTTTVRELPLKRLVLLGAGHAHLIVLREFAQSPPPDTELVLISPSRWQYYSGMLPGWIAGDYQLDQCRIEVAPQVTAAGGELILDRAVALDAGGRRITLAGGKKVDYDWLSIDIGASTSLGQLQDYAGQLLSVKPIEDFQAEWDQFVQASSASGAGHLAVVGGGAAGVELAMAAANVVKHTHEGGGRVSLIAGKNGPLPGFNARARRLAAKKMRRRRVTLIEQQAGARGGELALADGTLLKSNAVIAATGAMAAPFLRDSGLGVDEQGFVTVDACHQSLSHPNVFAVGDTCSRQDRALNRSGVHAVRAGPVLAENLRAAMAGGKLKPFMPRRYSLYLLSCGDQTAIGSYGPVTFSGRWVWRLKDRIDRGFIQGFAVG
jgi:pyridine nucleotide-disulfide oxidoreductase family protein